jgi:hypothetical protein
MRFGVPPLGGAAPKPPKGGTPNLPHRVSMVLFKQALRLWTLDFRLRTRPPPSPFSFQVSAFLLFPRGPVVSGQWSGGLAVLRSHFCFLLSQVLLFHMPLPLPDVRLPVLRSSTAEGG